MSGLRVRERAAGDVARPALPGPGPGSGGSGSVRGRPGRAVRSGCPARSRWGVAGAARRSPAGWTLIELVVTLLVLALGAAVALPAFRSLGGEEDGLVVATRRVGALLTLARDSAIRAGVQVTVVIDSVDARVWIDAREPEGTVWEAPETSGAGLARSGLASTRLTVTPLRAGATRSARDAARPADAVLELPAGVQLVLPTARARFTFQPSGAFDGDSVVLRRGAEARIIAPSPWNGDVRVR